MWRVVTCEDVNDIEADKAHDMTQEIDSKGIGAVERSS